MSPDSGWRIAQAQAEYNYIVAVVADWEDAVAEEADAERDYLNAESEANQARVVEGR